MLMCSWCWSWGHFSSISAGWCGLFATPSWAALRRSVRLTSRWWNTLCDHLPQRTSHGLLMWSFGTILCEDDTQTECRFTERMLGLFNRAGSSPSWNIDVLQLYTEMTQIMRQNDAFKVIVLCLFRWLWCRDSGVQTDGDADNKFITGPWCLRTMLSVSSSLQFQVGAVSQIKPARCEDQRPSAKPSRRHGTHYDVLCGADLMLEASIPQPYLPCLCVVLPQTWC